MKARLKERERKLFVSIYQREFRRKQRMRDGIVNGKRYLCYNVARMVERCALFRAL